MQISPEVVEIFEAFFSEEMRRHLAKKNLMVLRIFILKESQGWNTPAKIRSPNFWVFLVKIGQKIVACEENIGTF